MTPRLLDIAPAPGTDTWLKIISASKVPVILGISRFQSPFSLWHAMAGNVPSAPLEGDHLDWGHDAELSLAQWWKRRNPDWRLNTVRKGRSEITYHDPDLPFPNLATLDRRAINLSRTKTEGRYHIVECKTARDLDTWGKPGDQDAVPADYFSQVIFQMGVSGIHEASLVVLGSGVPEIHPVIFDQALFDGIIDRCMAWHESLQAGTPPELDDHPTTYETVRGLHPDIDRGRVVQISLKEATALLDGVHAEDEGKAAARAAKIHASELMDGARILKCGDVKIADRRSRDGGTPYIQFNKKADLQGVTS